jgi:membrane-bound ClpP family serine protease
MTDTNSSNRFDLASLVAGLALICFGAVLLLDQLDVFDLGFAAVGPIVCAVVGAILLAAGLGRRV